MSIAIRNPYAATPIKLIMVFSLLFSIPISLLVAHSARAENCFYAGLAGAIGSAVGAAAAGAVIGTVTTGPGALFGAGLGFVSGFVAGGVGGVVTCGVVNLINHNNSIDHKPNNHHPLLPPVPGVPQGQCGVNMSCQ